MEIVKKERSQCSPGDEKSSNKDRGGNKNACKKKKKEKKDKDKTASVRERVEETKSSRCLLENSEMRICCSRVVSSGRTSVEG